MFGMGPQEILIVLVVALIFIGPKRLPEIARTLGKGFGELKRAMDDVKGQVDLESMIRDSEDVSTDEESPNKDEESPNKDMDTTLFKEAFLGSGVSHADAEESKETDGQAKEEVPEKAES